MNKLFPSVAWSYNSNIYEVNLRQYTYEGSFNAFSRELPRLKDMGIEILWFMPITPISIEKRKGTLGSYYACSDYTDTNPEYGSLDDFKNLVEYAHQLGFKVIIDWVANHTGWDHRWTKEHPDFYLKDASGNFTERNGWDDVIDLDYDNPETRKAVIDAMKFWVERFDLDGFRCDMAHLVTLDFWREARTALEPIKKLFWLAECEEISYHEVFDATYTWRWMHKTEEFAKQQTDIKGLQEMLQEYNDEFPPYAFRAFFTSNHDENSWNGTEYEKYGNAAINLAVFSCLWNGLPLIYSGQEMPNQKRLKFFDKDPIEWNGKFELHDFYKPLLALRKRNAALRAGDNNVTTHLLQTSAPDKIFSFSRKCGSNEVVVLLNFSGEELLVEITDNEFGGIYKNTFTNTEADFSTNKTVKIYPWSYLVFER
ncbi:MAG: 1,4-alpha-glucan branching protein [Bacteroidetes bacterium]|nr:1,4-alpha-glucan branching protein [Bacteroidota bacterium]